MAGGLAHLEIAIAKRDHVVLHQIAVGALGAAVGRQRDPASGPLFQQPPAGHMIGMDVRFKGIGEAQAELFDQRRVASHLLDHRIEDDRRSAGAIGEQVGIGGGRRIEQLPENQHREAPMIIAAYGTIAGREAGEPSWSKSSLTRSPRQTGTAGPSCGKATSIFTTLAYRRRFSTTPGSG